MVNPSGKGTRIEAIARRCLERDGYVVRRTIRTPYEIRDGWRSNANDILGCDLVAKRAGERTRWIQVTSGYHIGEKCQDLAKVPWTPAHDSVEIWRWVPGTKHPGRYFQVYRLDYNYEPLAHDRIRA